MCGIQEAEGVILLDSWDAGLEKPEPAPGATDQNRAAASEVEQDVRSTRATKQRVRYLPPPRPQVIHLLELAEPPTPACSTSHFPVISKSLSWASEGKDSIMVLFGRLCF